MTKIWCLKNYKLRVVAGLEWAHDVGPLEGLLWGQGPVKVTSDRHVLGMGSELQLLGLGIYISHKI